MTRFTATTDDGTVMELNRMPVSRGDIVQVAEDAPRASVELLRESLPEGVLLVVGDARTLTEEERLSVARHIIRHESQR